jgi:CRISPR-associated exonuclease Cas4
LIQFIPISALSEYVYCPRNCYLFYVLGERGENPYTVEGELLHERVHESSRTKRDELIQLRRVYVYSKRFGMSGFADVLEEKEDKIYPVEYKRGRSGGWQNDEIQLCAQAICLEEMLNVEIVQAYIFYVSSKRRREVKLGKKLREDTIKTVEEVRALFKSKKIPPPLNNNRCRNCSLKPKCLPKETIKIKRAKLHWK